MEDTGRILLGIKERARQIVFGATADLSLEAELPYICQVDQAHLIMLAERGIIPRNSAALILREIGKLQASDFAPLRNRQAPRGCYLLYEQYLIEKLSIETGGVLQTARSRNDLNSTVVLLRIRKPYQRLLQETLRLVAILLRRARRYADVVMPAYTHYQAAVPVTYGHYLAGVAGALSRDTTALLELSAQLNRNPLGAGAVGGTSLPIDMVRTGKLLGFQATVPNSFDAIASRDLVVRLLAAAAILGITLSRISADLLLWTTAEFGFLTLPDDLIGSSSMMPQKRNPFLIEQAQGRSAAPLGALMAAATAMHGTPFTNSIAAGSEAVNNLWNPLRQVSEATTLLRLVIGGAVPQRGRMLERAEGGYTAATELANRLIVHGDLPFRAAHRKVGELVREATDNGADLQQAASSLAQVYPQVSLTGLDATSVVRESEFGGGPGPGSVSACLLTLSSEWSQQKTRVDLLRAGWSTAAELLSHTTEELCAEVSK
jgi:argininosuccinate lyase